MAFVPNQKGAPVADSPENPTKNALRDKILQAQDLRSELLDVPHWGVKVEIRTLTAKERSSLIGKAMNRQTGDIDYGILYPLLVVACTYDPETGEKVFTEADTDALGGKSGAAMEHIAQKAADLSGLTEEASNALGEGSSPVTLASTADDAWPST